MKPIRVLVVGVSDTAGGVENFLMTYCGRIDPKRVRFDFLTRYEQAAYPEQRRAIGKTYRIPLRSEDPARFYRELRTFFEHHAKEYDVIWDNEYMFNDLTPLKLAAEYEIPVRIAHSHNPQNVDPTPAGRAREVLHRTQRRMLARYATVLWACSEESAKWACPAMNLPFTIIPHAVDVQRFRYREDVRSEVRAHYGLTDCLVVGCVGRLQYQKNHGFLLESFARLHQREPRARLVLVGEGPELLALEAKAVSLGVSEAVLFLGHRDDVPRLLQAFDLFVMPSRVEGLGMAAVEAQAAGLPCILSSAFPEHAAITEDVTFLPPEDPDLWAERMLDTLESLVECVRPDTTQALARAGYELTEAADCLASRFEQLVREQPSFRRRFILTSKGGKVEEATEAARNTVLRIAQEAGYIPIEAQVMDKADKWWRKAWTLCQSVLIWVKLFFRLRHGDLLLVQYPWYPAQQAVALIAQKGLHFLQWKGAKTAAYVHELYSLMELNNAPARWSDQELLPRFDRVIVHNGRMASYMNAQGVAEEHLIPLTVKDCPTDSPMPERALAASVCVAGNLTRKRSRYLHDLPKGKVQWHLYGEGWKGKASRTDILYHGGKAETMEGSFGLVWAGMSLRTVSGAAGAYMMLQSPQVLSLYLAHGLPVIVWKWSALADFVQENHLGLVIDTLADISPAISALTAEDYAEMAASARAWGTKVRSGQMTRAALEKLK